MDNPYASPSSNLGGQESFSESSGVSPRALDIMSRTRPWALLGGILLLVTAGIALLGMFTGGAQNIIQGVIGLVLNLYLGATLMAYASRIEVLLASRKALDLERALDSHRTYWKVNGILITIGMAFIIIALLAAIGVAGSKAF